tara:strand:+ start:10524 stop:10697 length:174 start_codon:yes stop_codon:yes gene_type:complete
MGKTYHRQRTIKEAHKEGQLSKKDIRRAVQRVKEKRIRRDLCTRDVESLVDDLDYYE